MMTTAGEGRTENLECFFPMTVAAGEFWQTKGTLPKMCQLRATVIEWKGIFTRLKVS